MPIYFPVCLVYHNFFAQFGDTRLFVYQRPPGFGITAHRVIKAACEVRSRQTSQDVEIVIIMLHAFPP